jgi:hypothetical protein
MSRASAERAYRTAEFLRSRRVQAGLSWLRRAGYASAACWVIYHMRAGINLSPAEEAAVDQLPWHSLEHPIFSAYLGMGVIWAMGVIDSIGPVDRWHQRLIEKAARFGQPKAVLDVARGLVYKLKLAIDERMEVEGRPLGHGGEAFTQLASRAPEGDASSGRRLMHQTGQLVERQRLWRESRSLRRAKALSSMLREVPDALLVEPDASHYFLGLLSRRGPLPDKARAKIHFDLAYRAGNVAAGGELAFLLIEAGERGEARRLLRALHKSIPEGPLLQRVQLALAYLELQADDDRRDLVLATELVHRVLWLPQGESLFESDVPSDPWSLGETEVFVQANQLRHTLEAQAKQQVRREEQLRARDELYSFITHSIPSALSTVVSETKSSLQLLRRAPDATPHSRDLLIRKLSSVLGRAAFVDNLMVTHKLLVTGKDRLNDAWQSENAEAPAPIANMLLDGLKQALSQTLFTHREYEQLGIPKDDDACIDAFREESVTILGQRTLTVEDRQSFIAYLSARLPSIELDFEPDLTLSMSQSGVRIGIVLSSAAEMIRNGLKYRPTDSVLALCAYRSQDDIVFVVRNRIGDRRCGSMGGTQRGLAFIREFAATMDAIDFESGPEDGDYIAKLSIRGDPET